MDVDQQAFPSVDTAGIGPLFNPIGHLADV